ncbi:MAG: diaminopimelate epimerase, partial [Candidatus Baltobacteraceae bacterium]
VSKMHGARNDFIVVDARSQTLKDPIEFAQSLCNRRTGIGADGVLLIGESVRADISMRIINADGSEAEMCGNGIRCVARYVDEYSQRDALRVETSAGLIETLVVRRGKTYSVRVNMGIPEILNLDVLGNSAVVSVGNPHFVYFADSLESVDLVAYGERMQRDPAFPRGVNVHIAVVESGANALQMRHYERGVGLTMACGTGAVAAAAAAIERGAARSPIDVSVPGGELVVEWDGRGAAFMTGPAVHVFDTVV